MQRNELVSVIIPAYNTERTIKRCVDSCLAQTYPNIETIVVDDGSSDGTADLVREEYRGDKRIVLIQSENRGVSSARNLGIENCNGSFFTFLDSDDTLDVDAIEKMSALMAETDADISVCSKRNVCGDKISDQHFFRDFYLWTGTSALEGAVKDDPATYSSCAKLYSKEFVGDTRFEVGQKIHEDSFFLFKLFLKQPVVAVKDTAVYSCYFLENSASHAAYSDRLLDILRFAEEKRRIVNSEYPQFGKLAENIKIKADLAYLTCCYEKNAKGVKNIEIQCIKEVKKLKKSYIPPEKGENRMFRIVTRNLYFLTKPVFAIHKKLR